VDVVLYSVFFPAAFAFAHRFFAAAAIFALAAALTLRRSDCSPSGRGHFLPALLFWASGGPAANDCIDLPLQRLDLFQ
jgi:hypothetical protein